MFGLNQKVSWKAFNFGLSLTFEHLTFFSAEIGLFLEILIIFQSVESKKLFSDNLVEILLELCNKLEKYYIRFTTSKLILDI